MNRFLIVGITTCMLSPALYAATVTTTAVADATIVAGVNADTNYGSDTQLLAKSNSSLGSTTRKTYIRFDISSLDAPTLTPDAKLLLDVRSMNGNTGDHNFNVYGLDDDVAGQNWDESTITWNNAPGNNVGAQSSIAAADSTLLGTFSVANGTADADLIFSSAALDAFLLADTDGLLTIAITRTTFNSSANSSFYSKEYVDVNNPQVAYGPQLSFNAVPEPGSIALLAIGGLAMLRRRRV